MGSSVKKLPRQGLFIHLLGVLQLSEYMFHLVPVSVCYCEPPCGMLLVELAALEADVEPVI
jgi:hypothetical protein